MPDIGESAASLRFFGDDLDPDEVTRLLGKAPSKSQRKGDQLSGRVTKTGAWFLDASPRQPGDICGQIAEILEGASEDLGVWMNLSDQFQGDVYCGVFMSERSESLILSVETLAALAKRGLRIQFEIYDPVQEDSSPGEEIAIPSPTGA